MTRNTKSGDSTKIQQKPATSKESNFNPKTTQNLKKNTTKTTSARGKVIVIDPGHGGKDCGAMGVDRVCEKHIVLKVGKYLNDELKKRGYKVYMTRQKDIFIGLRQRTSFANNKNADLCISVHHNSFTSSAVKLKSLFSTLVLFNISAIYNLLSLIFRLYLFLNLQ